MKVSELIQKLEEYKNERGDLDILFTVYDSYGGSYDAHHHLGTMGKFWENTSSNGKQVRLNVHLEKQEYVNVTKNPKITFRK